MKVLLLPLTISLRDFLFLNFQVNTFTVCFLIFTDPIFMIFDLFFAGFDPLFDFRLVAGFQASKQVFGL